MKKYYLSLLLCATVMCSLNAQSTGKNPSFEEVISLRSGSNAQVSPDGRHVAFTVNSTDWQANRFDTEIWLSKDGAAPFPLTRTEASSSSSPSWSPTGQWIAFRASRGKNTQIWLISPQGGEAWPLTNLDRDVQGMAWSPDGRQIAITLAEPEAKDHKKRSERYGEFAIDDQEFRRSWLYLVTVPNERPEPNQLPCYDAKDSTAQAWPCLTWPEAKPLVDSVDYHVANFDWSPDGRFIAFTKRPDPLINSSGYSDVMKVEVATKEVTPVVARPGVDSWIAWSPDSQSLLVSSSEGDSTSYYYRNERIFIVDRNGGPLRRIAADFDEDLYSIQWTGNGIYSLANQRTEIHLFRIDPRTGKTTRIMLPHRQINNYQATSDGRQLAYFGTDGQSLPELFTTSASPVQPKAITQFSAQLAGWQVAQSEVIQWASRDGARIEGVLHKPQHYDPQRKYPLLVVIHGGPTGVDRPTPVPAYVYPIVQWLNKGALVLRVNYRGSAGYGEAFRSLNVRNLGVGDAWDVLSGVDYLAGQGLIDTTRMGCMGWSQGGYISAFLTTTSKRFRAISVGAGISNWMTYYVNTDIHPFTRQYLQGTPWSDPEIYAKTSPMTYINQAATPTLIQHGELDPRVPIPNAYELLQGLRDRQIPAELVVYKGFGHGITKPKERLAAVWHNWQWFSRYVWGEEVEIPTK